MGYDGARGADNKIHMHVGHGKMIYWINCFFILMQNYSSVFFLFEMLVLW